MPEIEVRPFRRGDREQLTRLVNAHSQAVVPGVTVSVNTVMSQLERQPGEPIVDPWVSERLTLVAEQRSRVAAAAHLLRFFPEERAGHAYRGAGEIHWLLFWPEAPAGNPCWPDAAPAAGALMTACLGQFTRWGVTSQQAGGELPAPGVYGVPEQWPHIASLYESAGFAHTGHTEGVYLARVQDLPHDPEPPLPGLTARRSVGTSGTRLSAVLGSEVAGYIETELLGAGERLPRQGGWADVGNLRVAERYRRRGVATWLLGQAAGWLRLAQVDRLLGYAYTEGTDAAGHDYSECRAFLDASGFTLLTRTCRGWTRRS